MTRSSACTVSRSTPRNFRPEHMFRHSDYIKVLATASDLSILLL